MVMKSLPNFLIIGAAKAGTSTLYEQLKTHPEIYMPQNKEPMFFSSDEKYQKGLGWYEQTFFRSAENFIARGEATPHYLYWAEKVAPRLKSSFRDGLRYIVILRDPVQRAYSWYWNMVREGNEKLSFAEAIKLEPSRLSDSASELFNRGSMKYGYLRGSLYTQQLKFFLSHFPRENFLFLLQEDLKTDYQEAFSQIFSFLSVSNQVVLKIEKQNQAAMPRFQWLQEFLARPSGLVHKLVKPLTGRLSSQMRFRLKSAIRKSNLKQTSYPELDSQLKEELKAFFRQDLRELENLIGRDLSLWY